MEPRKPSLLEQLAAVLATAIMVWYATPPQERMWAKLKVLGGLHQLAGRLAYREGHRGMGDELRGKDLQRYPVAYRLSQVRDMLGQALEDMRP